MQVSCSTYFQFIVYESMYNWVCYIYCFSCIKIYWLLIKFVYLQKAQWQWQRQRNKNNDVTRATMPAKQWQLWQCKDSNNVTTSTMQAKQLQQRQKIMAMMWWGLQRQHYNGNGACTTTATMHQGQQCQCSNSNVAMTATTPAKRWQWCQQNNSVDVSRMPAKTPV